MRAFKVNSGQLSTETSINIREYFLNRAETPLQCLVKAISDTLKQIGPSTFVNFTRSNKGLIILLLY